MNDRESANLLTYMLGIVVWKFALETMNTCLSGIVLNRLDYNLTTGKGGAQAGLTWTTMQSLNLTAQVLGVLLVGPLFKRFRPSRVLSFTAFAWGMCVLVIPILEAATGGRIPATFEKGSLNAVFWGSWSPYLIYVFFILAGVFSGIIEMIRRVIPANIMGGDSIKLKQMDASVHMANELAGTAGAILARYWISYFGWGFALTLLPIGFSLASLLWLYIKPSPEQLEYENRTKEPKSIMYHTGDVVFSAGYSIYYGAKLVLFNRNLIWLIPAYSLGLVGHRFVEGTVFPFYAKEMLKNSDLQTVLTGGSNFGEFLGGMIVLITAASIKTPIPWIRLDAICMLVSWVFPFYKPTGDYVAHAWTLFPLMMLLSFGWSAGDVSLAAHVQGSLHKYDNLDSHTTPLHSVMSFLYIINLVFYFVINFVCGKIRDSFIASGGNLTVLFINIAAVPMTIAALIIFASTFIPVGSLSWNPDAPDKVDQKYSDEATIVVLQNA